MSSDPRKGAGLGTRIRGWMLVGGGIPLIALFFFGYLSAHRVLTEASDDHLVSVVEARRSRIEAWLRERVTDLEVIGGSKDCIELVQQAASHADHAHVCRYLESFQTGARDYQALALYDLDGNRVALNTSSTHPGEASLEESMRSELHAGKGPVVVASRNVTTGGPGLLLANKLVPVDDSSVGYVVASLDLNGTFAPILGDRAGLGKTGQVYLADMSHAGRILLPPPDDSTAVVAAPILDAVTRSGIGTVHYKSRAGKTLFAGFTMIEEQGWLVVAEMEEAEALALLHSLRRGFLIAGILTILGVILFSARVAHSLSSPLGQLASAARRIKGGHPHARVPALTGREVAEVGLAMNEMLDSLEELKRQEIQTRTLAAVGELSSGVVHEIRNRLSSVKMNLQALEKRVRGEEKYAELGQIAFDQVVRIEGLLNDLLHYARPITLSIASCRLDDILRDSIAPLRTEAEERGVELDVESSQADAKILVDRKRVEEVCSNLVRNAIEATGREGRVVLRGEIGAPPERSLILEVEDNGPGLEEEAAEELFKPFFTTKEGGTGLGLAHARKIVELHGGEIGARNRNGGGAVFRVVIPQKVVTG